MSKNHRMKLVKLYWKTPLMALLLSAVLLGSCKKDQPSTIQQFFIHQQDDANYISLTVPASIIPMTKDSIDPKMKNLRQRFKSLNVLSFKPSDTVSQASIAKEKALLKRILKKEKDYQTLMKINSEGNAIKVLAKGDFDEELLDEILIYISKGKGQHSSDNIVFVLVRLLGDKVPLDDLMSILDHADIDPDKINDLLKGF